MINWKRVAELKSEVGEEDFAEVMDMFFEEVEEVLEKLGESTPQGLISDLHFVKGSSLNIGLDAVSELCRSSEESLRANPALAIDVTGIQNAFNAAKSELKTVVP